MKHYGYFDKAGKLHCESFRLAIEELRANRVPVVLTAKEFHPGRSNKANRYYFGVVVDEIGKGLAALGWEPRDCGKEAVHEMMKREFLSVDKHLSNGTFLKATRRTRDLDSQEFAQYVEHCVRWAAEELKIAIPAPGEQMTIAA